MAIGKTLSIVLEGKGPVTLRPNDHIATGGEGSIYRVGDLAVKLYLDPLKMRQAGMPEKVKTLAALVHPYVIGPRGLALSGAGDPVGHYLPFVDHAHALSLVFTNEFWAKESFSIDRASELVAGMREAVEFAHGHNAVMVDANELNWMAIVNGKAEPRVIDVDSWAIGKWPATVIMPSIRDWNAKTFDRQTDWFAWGIVTFQIYTGIHPYKGTLPGYDRGDLVGRMKANASVFSPGVKLNRAVRDFATIPWALRSWYEATFQQGGRCSPPSPYDKAVSAAPAARTMRVATVLSGGLLAMDRILARLDDSVVRVFFCGVALTDRGVLVDLESQREIGRASKRAEVVKVSSGWLVGDSGQLQYIPENTLRATALPLQVQSRAMLSYENRLFAVTESGLVEIKVQIFGGNPVASFGQTWGILVNSTRWFDGVGVLDAMGATYLVVPFGDESVLQVRVKELDGLRVLAGKAGNRFVSLIAIDKSGTYRKFELTFDRDYALPPKIWEGPADGPELNLAILPKGVCATIVKDGELDIFVPTTGAVRRVDGNVTTDMALANWRDTVVYIQNGDVWTLRLK